MVTIKRKLHFSRQEKHLLLGRHYNAMSSAKKNGANMPALKNIPACLISPYYGAVGMNGLMKIFENPCAKAKRGNSFSLINLLRRFLL